MGQKDGRVDTASKYNPNQFFKYYIKNMFWFFGISSGSGILGTLSIIY